VVSEEKGGVKVKYIPGVSRKFGTWNTLLADAKNSEKCETVLKKQLSGFFRPKFGLINASHDPNVLIDRNVKPVLGHSP
jgi:hypothetical protein